jgi:hypothetical protein
MLSMMMDDENEEKKTQKKKNAIIHIKNILMLMRKERTRQAYKNIKQRKAKQFLKDKNTFIFFHIHKKKIQEQKKMMSN